MPKKKDKRNLLFPLLFIIIPGIVAVIAVGKLLVPNENYVYVKVKISQGLWWSTTKSPDYWFIESLEKGAQEKDIAGQTIAELSNFKYYPHLSQNSFESSETTYNIYLKLKLRVKKSADGTYSYKRNKIAIGSPIELNFPKVQITGVIIELSEKPIKGEYVTRAIELTGRNSFPWEYDSIKIGDTYFDGEEEVFKVLNKNSRITRIIAPDLYGNLPSTSLEQRRYVTVTAEVKLEEKEDGRLFFGEEQEISIGKPFNFLTPSANYSFLTISDIR
jgi:hypothetical protein